MSKKTKKDDVVYTLMIQKSCELAGIPCFPIDTCNHFYLHKNKVNSCPDCHSFKSTSDEPQQTISPKKRLIAAHKCTENCEGFHKCHHIKVRSFSSMCSGRCLICVQGHHALYTDCLHIVTTKEEDKKQTKQQKTKSKLILNYWRLKLKTSKSIHLFLLFTLYSVLILL